MASTPLSSCSWHCCFVAPTLRTSPFLVYCILLPDFADPLCSRPQSFPLRLFCYDLWLQRQATIFICFLSYSCFQVKHSSLGHPGLGTILRRLMWLHFHCIHHNSQKRSRTLATHRIRMKFCQGKRPSFLSQEQLPRCKDPLSYVCIFYLSIYISCLIIYFRAIDHKIGFFVNPIFC